MPIPKPILTSNDQRRSHWTVVSKAKADTERIVSLCATNAKIPPMGVGPVTIQLVWYVPTQHRRDVDALAPTMKACLDALTKKGIIADDHGGIVTEVTLGPITIDRDNPRMELIIRRLADLGAVPTDRPGDVVPGGRIVPRDGEEDLQAMPGER